MFTLFSVKCRDKSKSLLINGKDHRLGLAINCTENGWHSDEFSNLTLQCKGIQFTTLYLNAGNLLYKLLLHKI